MEYGSSREKILNVMVMRCLRSMCGVTCVDQVRNEMQRRTGVTRVEQSSVLRHMAVCWTHGENGGGPVGEGNTRI